MKKLIFTLYAMTLLSLSLASCNNESDISNERKDINLTRSEQTILENQNRFALDMFHSQFEKDEDFTATDNTLLSPISASQLLGLIANGASGEALEEIVSVLCPDGNTLQDLNSLNRNLTNALMSADKQTSIIFANSVWVANPYRINAYFEEKCKTYYDATCKNANFYSSSDIEKINSWVLNKTNGLINTNIVKDPSKTALFANVIYFKGEWTHPFDEKQTQKANFYNVEGTVKSVDMMNKSFDGVKYASTSDCKVVGLPYGNEAFSMYAVLPSENVKFAEFISSFDSKKWSEIKKAVYPAKSVSVSLPKFEVRYELHIDKLLKAAGINKIYENNRAMSGISDDITEFNFDILQNSVFKLGETGVEAATVTHTTGDILDITITDEKKVVNLNRPFIYLIEEQSTGAIVYIGEIHKL